MVRVLLVFLLVLAQWSGCHRPLKPKVQAAFVVADDGVHYKGKVLQPRMHINQWIEALGEPDRILDEDIHIVREYIWDDLGIGIRTGNVLKDKNLVYGIYFFFLGHDSEELKTGKLWPNLLEIAPVDEEEVAQMRARGRTEEEIERLREKHDPRHFFVPYKTFSGRLFYQGIPIGAKAKIEEVNLKLKAKKHKAFWLDTTFSFLGQTTDEQTVEGLYVAKPTDYVYTDIYWNFLMRFSCYQNLSWFEISCVEE